MRNALRTLKEVLPAGLVTTLKHGRNTFFAYWDRLFSVDKEAFRQGLRDLGIRSGEILYVRSSYDHMRSIRVTPVESIEILCEIVGSSGTVAMPTYPTTGLSQEYLDENPFFDWRRTPSRSGLLTEVFRRMPGTERSLHPTHSLAARGAVAHWLTHGHEECETPFDEHSPYQKLLDANAFVLSIGHFDDTPLRHLADHAVQDQIPYPIYTDRATKVRVIAKDGTEHVIMVRAHNPALRCDFRIVLPLMAREGLLKMSRVGRVPVFLFRLRPYVEAYRRYYEQGLFWHYLEPLAAGRR